MDAGPILAFVLIVAAVCAGIIVMDTVKASTGSS
jgi:hypothetical protein